MAFNWASSKMIGPLAGIALVVAAIAVMVATRFGMPLQEPGEIPDNRRLLQMNLLVSAAKCAFAVKGKAPPDKHALADTLSGELPSIADPCHDFQPSSYRTLQHIRTNILSTSNVTYAVAGATHIELCARFDAALPGQEFVFVFNDYMIQLASPELMQPRRAGRQCFVVDIGATT